MKKVEKVLSVSSLVLTTALALGMVHLAFKNYQVNTDAFRIALIALILATSQVATLVISMLKETKN